MSLWHFFLDLVFPRLCVRCEREGSWLCSACALALPDCITSIASELHHGADVFAWLTYQDAWVAQLMRAAKYSSAHGPLPRLGQLLAMRYRTYAQKDTHCDYVTCVPMHRSKERRRGFNASALIALAFARELGMPYATLLIKNRSTASQARLSLDERRTNLKNSLSVVPTFRETGKNVILIDDVITTGATTEEAARTLHDAGLRLIAIVALARSVRQRP